MDFENEKQRAKKIRSNIIRMVHTAGSGHPGGSLSAVDILNVLFFDVMDIHKENLHTYKRDRFVLSKGHASPLLYSILAQKGFLAEAELLTFRQLGSSLQGHPNMKVAGVDMSTGSLGQGISTAVGMAMSNKLNHRPHRVYTLLGDGECEEGQVWEAAMSASHYKLDNLCAIVDFNGLQIDGDITNVMNPTPIDEKFKSFGWHVLDIDGHDYSALLNAFETAKTYKDKPTLILAHTIKGKGVSFMEHNAAWHGSAPNKEQCAIALQDINGGCTHE